ncbi:CBS domain-containing protein [Natrononativus amylolyticus]|uniref:CBS domain-containing protein n=1 Tax=Natrononativus amylolyticus TaxID=2963434 RepID=UPI0020CBCEB7|nr:CBS domain-containing protein [Natrononativus amylolyticus]
MEAELSVTDVLTTEYVGVSESDTVLGAVQLMRDERVGCVLVVRGSEPVGIMTEWDVLGVVAAERSPAETTVGAVMSAPVLTIEANRSVTDAADLMTKEAIRNLVVTDGDDTLGVLTQRDVIAAAGSFQAVTSSNRPAEAPLTALGVEGDRSGELVTNGGDEYSTQGVCELCGSLADSLWDSNGQLVCADCRGV